MRGLDTNVLVRYLTQDDPIQSATATREIESALNRAESWIISPIVLCELVWVLESAYDCTRGEIAIALERIFRTAQFDILEKDTVWGAWTDYQDGKGDFADYYLGRRHRQEGAETTVTFDKALTASSLFHVLT